MINNKIYISIVVPVYNESKRIDNLPKIVKFFENTGQRSEILIVNDGSTDNTFDKLINLQKKYSFKLISYKKNKGKGFAIKKGMLQAKGGYRLFMDIDLSTPLKEYNKFISYFGNYDVIIGSRRTKGSNIVKHQPRIRESMGRVFTRVSQLILGLKLTDFTCGFKCFSAKSVKEIFSRQKIERWGFDSEILFLANKYGFSIKEIPVSWENNSSSRVKFPQDMIRSFWELLQIRFIHMGDK